MTIYDRPAPAWRVPPPAACLALLLLLAAAMLLLPARAAIAVRKPVLATLRPGLAAVASVRERIEATLGVVGNIGSAALAAAERERELTELRQRVGQLEAEAVWLRSLEADAADQHDAFNVPALLRPRLVEARVLGRQAQSALVRHGLLDAGVQAGVSAGDLVLDLPPAMVDQGAAAGAASGQLVLAGRRVWGKIAQVQSHVSLVRRATEAGYRDLVRIAQPNGQRLVLGPRGILEGTGEPLCRVRLVPLTEAVSAGQLIVTDGVDLVDGRFLYGHIERIEQPHGAAHWDIWMRPAVSQDVPHKVAVLTAEVTATARSR